MKGIRGRLPWNGVPRAGMIAGIVVAVVAILVIRFHMARDGQSHLSDLVTDVRGGDRQ